MKTLRNIYLIIGAFAIAFALFANIVPGIKPAEPSTAFEFARGFCWGVGSALIVAGAVTAAIQAFRKKNAPAEPASGPASEPAEEA